jgi:hypothetical protein
VTGADDELLARLAAAIEAGVDDVPEELSDVARAAGTWMLVDEELATLVDAEATALRDAADDAVTTFAGGSFTIELAIVDGTLVGTVSPATGATVVVEVMDRAHDVSVDGRGRFRFPDVELPYRVRISGGDRRVATPWVTT